jgi:hypothetical protein
MRRDVAGPSCRTNGEDLRGLPLHLRKNNLARMLAPRPDGIFISDFEQGEIGPDSFRKACEFGLEGLVSKHREWPYRAGKGELDKGEEPEAPGYAQGQGGVLMTVEEDPFDLWVMEWINHGRLNDFENIPARIRDAVMMLTPEERENRAIVIETVRTKRPRYVQQGAQIGMVYRGRRSSAEE